MPVELYLIRHGLAAERGEAYPDDSKRPLTPQGIARLQREARGLAALGISFDQIITSPLARARQTAEVFAERLDGRPAIATMAALAPDGAAAQVIEELAAYSRRQRIALVGHEPNMGELAARLLGLRRPLEFKKGAVCRIDCDALPPARPGQLRWFAPPRMLRRLAT